MFRLLLVAVTLFTVACSDQGLIQGPDDYPVEFVIDVTSAISDPDSITLVLNGVGRGTVPGSGGRLTIRLAEGTYGLEVGDLAANCDLDLPTPHPLVVGGNARRTVELTISCFAAKNHALAFVMNTREWTSDIFITDLEGSSVRNLTNTPYLDEAQPSWSPDGRRLVFVTNGTRLGIINADGTARRSLDVVGPRGMTGVSHPHWTPDGSRLVVAVAQSGEGAPGLWIVDAEDGRAERLTVAPPFGVDLAGGWLPDGRLVFVRFIPGDGAGREEVRTLDVSNGQSALLREFSNEYWVFPPVPSGDGSSIAVLVAGWDPGTSRVHIVRLDGSATQVIQRMSADSPLGWAYQDRALVLLSGRRLQVLRTDRSERQTLATLPEYARDLTVTR